eukprot:scaffold75723_cov29-Tisochrysis_lutea.AAC.2
MSVSKTSSVVSDRGLLCHHYLHVVLATRTSSHRASASAPVMRHVTGLSHVTFRNEKPRVKEKGAR